MYSIRDQTVRPAAVLRSAVPVVVTALIQAPLPPSLTARSSVSDAICGQPGRFISVSDCAVAV